MTGSSLYRRVMGDSFLRLHPAIQRFHSLVGSHVLQGDVQMRAPQSWLARLLARLMGTPLNAVDGAIRFELDAEPDRETWTRHFPSGVMTSALMQQHQFVVEKLGAARLAFALQESQGRLIMQLEHLHFFGIRCPAWLLPAVVAEESGDEDFLRFNVSASLPWIGVVSGYCGKLLIPKEPNP